MVAMRATEKTSDTIVCKVEQSGRIRSRQGVNLPGVALSTPSLTEKDRGDLKWALDNELDFVGLSFVRSSDDVALLRGAISEHPSGHQPFIISKIEKTEAVDDIEAILDVTDAIMVARGDLGVEADITQVPILQKKIINLCNQHRVPVITATQMLDSMQENDLPTRAEATDVANAVIDGTDAVAGNADQLTERVDTWGRKNGILVEGDRMVLVTKTKDQGHDMMLIHSVE